MKVIHLSTTDYGGAYKATERISQAMRECGCDSNVLVRTKTKPDTVCKSSITNIGTLFLSKALNALNLVLSKGDVTSDYFGLNISKRRDIRKADAVYIHWANAYVSYSELEKIAKLKKTVCIVMHDTWYITGGCHCNLECDGYKTGCEQCPITGKGCKIAKRNYLIKEQILSKYSNISFIGVSEWMAQCARNSRITKGHEVKRIYNPIDTKCFYPRTNCEDAKRKYNIPNGKKVILFGAMQVDNELKGYRFLQMALQLIGEKHPDEYEAVVFGGDKNVDNSIAGIEIIGVGRINDDEQLAYLYNVADVMVSSSLQESFGYTICEALYCGTPVAAFGVGGVKEQICHKVNGYLSEARDYESLAEGIIWCCDNYKKGRKPINQIDCSYKNIGRAYMDVIK